MIRNLLRASALLLLPALFAACSWAPLPYTVDLKARLGPNASGNAQHEIGAGDAGEINFRHPGDDGECLNFQEVDIPVTVHQARLHYDASVDYSGPELKGNISAQLYVSDDLDDLWHARNEVGPQVTVNLRNADTRLNGTAVLNQDQVAGINERYLCWGIRISGDDVEALESGEASIEYTVDQLKLAIRYSVI